MYMSSAKKSIALNPRENKTNDLDQSELLAKQREKELILRNEGVRAPGPEGISKDYRYRLPSVPDNSGYSGFLDRFKELNPKRNGQLFPTPLTPSLIDKTPVIKDEITRTIMPVPAPTPDKKPILPILLTGAALLAFVI